MQQRKTLHFCPKSNSAEVDSYLGIRLSLFHWPKAGSTSDLPWCWKLRRSLKQPSAKCHFRPLLDRPFHSPLEAKNLSLVCSLLFQPLPLKRNTWSLESKWKSNAATDKCVREATVFCKKATLLVSRGRTIHESNVSVRCLTIVSHTLPSTVPFISERQDGHDSKPTRQGLLAWLPQL